MIKWDVATQVKAAAAVGLVAACAVSGVSLASSVATPTANGTPTASTTKKGATDDTMYSGTFAVDTSARAVAANDAALAREVAPSGELRLEAQQPSGIKGMAASAQSVLNTRSRASIMSAAATWIEDKVPYCQTRLHAGYRMDCSGFVSMAWGLNKPGRTTFTLSSVSSAISWRNMQKGDIALNTQRHVMLFAGWANAEKTTAVFWHSTSSNGTCPMNRGAVVTARSIASLTAGGYSPRRRLNVTDAQPSGTTTPSPSPSTTQPTDDIPGDNE